MADLTRRWFLALFAGVAATGVVGSEAEAQGRGWGPDGMGPPGQRRSRRERRRRGQGRGPDGLGPPGQRRRRGWEW